MRVAGGQRRGQLDQLEQLGDPAAAPRRSARGSPKRDVARPRRGAGRARPPAGRSRGRAGGRAPARRLADHRGRPPRRSCRRRASTNPAIGAQQRGLAAARRAEDRGHAVLDHQVDAAQHRRARRSRHARPRTSSAAHRERSRGVSRPSSQVAGIESTISARRVGRRGAVGDRGRVGPEPGRQGVGAERRRAAASPSARWRPPGTTSAVAARRGRAATSGRVTRARRLGRCSPGCGRRPRGPAAPARTRTAR